MGVTTKPSREMSASRVPVTMRDFFFDDPFFKNSWEDFDRVRDAMFTESREKWLKFDEDFRNMACMSNNIMLESSPDTDKKEEMSDPRSLVRQDSKSRWESQYRPDELKVSVSDGVLVVEGSTRR